MTPDEIMKMEGIAPELRKVLAEMVSGTASLDARVTVRDAVCAAWRRRGDEGSTGSTAGGQSYTYEDIEATLHKNIVAAGLRVLRL